jgi:UDP-glucose 4-epimerase
MLLVRILAGCLEKIPFRHPHLDLAVVYRKAIEKSWLQPELRVFNLGKNCGHSVLEVMKSFQRVSGRSVPFRMVAGRAGDAAASFADSRKAGQELDWFAQYPLDDICRDAWNWYCHRPNGYPWAQ